MHKQTIGASELSRTIEIEYWAIDFCFTIDFRLFCVNLYDLIILFNEMK
jgi:hypothetical protein